MSRLDDFDYPPGMSIAHGSSSEREHAYHHANSASLGGLTPSERRTSNNVMGYASYMGPHASLPRSAAGIIPEYDYPGMVSTDNWPQPNTNRQSAPLNTSQVISQQIPSQLNSQFQHYPSFTQNHNHLRRPSPPPPPISSPPANGPVYIANGNNGSGGVNGGLYSSSSFSDRDPYFSRSAPPSSFLHGGHPSSPDSYTTRSTLWWGGLEPWMDEEYAKQVCSLMGWNPSEIKVPRPSPDAVTGQQANNPGYCYLTFTSPAHAASVLAQMNNNASGPLVMPNSSKPFALNWASNVPSAHPSQAVAQLPASHVSGQRFEKEYSIFVGDLPPEASNSDLVAVFRNPVLGLRNDREPKLVRPFLSCKSAKIMLDPVTGVSRGYGFVRFTDETDQQRALVEMHGLYCLSRPMRISPATAKFKVPPGLAVPQVQFPPNSPTTVAPQTHQPVTIALPLPSTNQAKSVSAPIAANSGSSPEQAPNSHPNGSGGISASTSGIASSFSGSLSVPSLSSGSSTSASSSSLASAPSEEVLKMLAQYANGAVPSSAYRKQPSSSNSVPDNGSPPGLMASQYAPQQQQQQADERDDASKYQLSEESWKHHAQARAILSNLIGPNGEQLTSSDPYNTTVFVGGLSPLISEETLRTFFAPFGEIHYVKVPVGKHCGFVQFVHKKDAERAIEKMQGFPIGGSRIRLSWGRSQYKAAQAAAQAAQAAALQAQLSSQANPQQPGTTLTAEQAIQILQKFGLTAFLGNAAVNGDTPQPVTFSNNVSVNVTNSGEGTPHATMTAPRDRDSDGGMGGYESFTSGSFSNRSSVKIAPPPRSTFSPFSPDPNIYSEGLGNRERESLAHSRSEPLPHPSKSYAPGFGPSLRTEDVGSYNGSGKISPVTPTSSSQPQRPGTQRYNSYLSTNSAPFDPSRALSRTSTRTSYHGRDQSKELEGHEHDAIQDLNGTLASLDLDSSHGWKAGDIGQEKKANNTGGGSSASSSQQ
ncbi:hypothetical protein JAAARDRAFT_187503 [Jaapia argillacea MUCL 33604]|uniref:RRM domain-containing protein n=1 Tax=Jaapia argillacea MUCL 33604 TaxID=933084 RepID=A0A067QNC1_9AGAM|nr:hypothetical protein JAAARDRAFT_187503 [Jaapia argillacea MUCL 33604]